MFLSKWLYIPPSVWLVLGSGTGKPQAELQGFQASTCFRSLSWMPFWFQPLSSSTSTPVFTGTFSAPSPPPHRHVSTFPVFPWFCLISTNSSFTSTVFVLFCLPCEMNFLSSQHSGIHTPQSIAPALPGISSTTTNHFSLKSYHV